MADIDRRGFVGAGAMGLVGWLPGQHGGAGDGEEEPSEVFALVTDLLDIERSAAVVDSLRPLVDLLLVTFHGGAEGVKALSNRPYIDKNRVGIYGTSYGGYASGMSILRHPDVYAAASASSPIGRLLPIEQIDPNFAATARRSAARLRSTAMRAQRSTCSGSTPDRMSSLLSMMLLTEFTATA